MDKKHKQQIIGLTITLVGLILTGLLKNYFDNKTSSASGITVSTDGNSSKQVIQIVTNRDSSKVENVAGNKTVITNYYSDTNNRSQSNEPKTSRSMQNSTVPSKQITAKYYAETVSGHQGDVYVLNEQNLTESNKTELDGFIVEARKRNYHGNQFHISYTTSGSGAQFARKVREYLIQSGLKPLLTDNSVESGNNFDGYKLNVSEDGLTFFIGIGLIKP